MILIVIISNILAIITVTFPIYLGWYLTIKGISALYRHYKKVNK